MPCIVHVLSVANTTRGNSAPRAVKHVEHSVRIAHANLSLRHYVLPSSSFTFGYVCFCRAVHAIGEGLSKARIVARQSELIRLHSASWIVDLLNLKSVASGFPN